MQPQLALRYENHNTHHVETQIQIQILHAPQYLKGALINTKLIKIDIQSQTDQAVTVQKVIV